MVWSLQLDLAEDKTHLEEYTQKSNAVIPAVWAETRHKELIFYQFIKSYGTKA